MSEQVGLLPPVLTEDPVRRALDCLQEGFQILGFDWRYLYVNPAAARHGRRPAHELIGRSIIDEYPGIDRTPLWDRLRGSMEGRRSQVFETEFTFPDGARRWFELRVQPVPEGICIYSADIDARKRRRQEQGGMGGLARRLWHTIGGR
jgi:PAS domain S-box-containing protein